MSLGADAESSTLQIFFTIGISRGQEEHWLLQTQHFRLKILTFIRFADVPKPREGTSHRHQGRFAGVPETRPVIAS